MKILHIINSLNTGGAEKLVVDILPLLNQKGMITDLALLNAVKTPFYEKLMQQNKFEGEIYQFSIGSVYSPFHIFKIVPLLNKYDVIHAHLFPVQYFLVLAKILSFSKTKLIFTEHSTSNRRLQNSNYKWIEKFIYKHYSKIICITEEVKEVLKSKLQLPENRLEVINNGISLSEIKECKAYNKTDFGFSTEDKLLVMVAGFRTEKDQDTLIKCIKILPSNYKLILVGDGERKSILESLIKEENLQDRITLLGIRNDVISIIKMCNVAVLSSHWEGFGLAAAEAMACGVPTIASDVKGLNKVVENGGLLFEKGNIEDLKDKIMSLEDEAFYQSICEKGKEKAQQYDIEEMVNNLLLTYKK